MKLICHHLVHFCVVFLCVNNFLVYSAPQNNNPNISTLNVQNPLAPSEAALKEKKIQEKRFSDLKASFLNKGTSASYDRDRERYGSNRPDPVEHRYNGNSNSDTRGSSSINADGFITSYGGHENRYPSTYGYGGNRDRVSVGGYYGSSDGYGDDGYDNTYRRPYGPPQAVDMTYPYNKGYESNGLDWGSNGYGHGYQGGSYQLSKSALIPLAGAALLGLAAVLVTNPAILHLGMFSGKRRKRDLSDMDEKSSFAHSLAYKSQRSIYSDKQ